MFYICLPQEYRAKVNELVKLFLPEHAYSYLNTIPALSSTEALLQFELHLSGEESFPEGIWSISPSKDGKCSIQAVLSDNNKILYREAMPIRAKHSRLKQDLKMPLKILIYKCLSEYTGEKLPWGALTGIRPVKLINAMLEEGRRWDEISEEMMGFHQLSPEKACLAIEVARNERKILTQNKNAVSVYIGIPFCTSRCLYCSFASLSTQRYGMLMSPYLKALRKELEWTAQWLRANKIPLDTLYIGGGTPTALPEETFDQLVNDIVPLLPMEGIREYTVEAGRPDTISSGKLRSMKRAGVSRISINPQTMQDKTLRIIGRNHTSEQITEAFDMARDEDFQNINCDLIAGLPEETQEDFEDTLCKVRELNPESVTVHTLAVKRASRLHEEQLSFTNSTDEGVSGMVDFARAFLREMGMHPYYLYRQKNILANLENVGYAKPGFEGIYNILTMEEVQSIIALGAGGISKMVYPGNHIDRIFNLRNVEQYICRINEIIERKVKGIPSQCK